MLHDGECITHQIPLRCVDTAGQTMTLNADFGYDSEDPFAVSMTFRTGSYEVVWNFARELLITGLTDPAGEGDVYVWPCLDPEGRPIVVIELSSPDGELLVQGPARDVSDFVAHTTAAVPVGTESDHIDVDDLIDQLFAV
jgi:hypothetical protein